MPKELIVSIGFEFRRGNRRATFLERPIYVDVQGDDALTGTFVAGIDFSNIVLPRGNIGTTGYLLVRNKHPKTSPPVEDDLGPHEAYFVNGAFDGLVRLPPGEIALFRPTDPFYCIAPNGDCELEYMIVEA